MKRGDIYFARLMPTEGSEQSGIRPAIIVSRNSINRASSVVVVVPLTKVKKGQSDFPINVKIKASQNGLAVDSVALTGQIRAISKTRFTRKVGTVSKNMMQKIERALKITLDLYTN